MGIGDNYHDPLRRIFHKVMRGRPGHCKELVPALANKAINDIMGPEGLVPSLLIFGSVPRVPAGTIGLHDREKRIYMLQCARNEMERITSKLGKHTVLI